MIAGLAGHVQRESRVARPRDRAREALSLGSNVVQKHRTHANAKILWRFFCRRFFVTGIINVMYQVKLLILDRARINFNQINETRNDAIYIRYIRSRNTWRDRLNVPKIQDVEPPFDGFIFITRYSNERYSSRYSISSVGSLHLSPAFCLRGPAGQ